MRSHGSPRKVKATLDQGKALLPLGVRPTPVPCEACLGPGIALGTEDVKMNGKEAGSPQGACKVTEASFPRMLCPCLRATGTPWGRDQVSEGSPGKASVKGLTVELVDE